MNLELVPYQGAGPLKFGLSSKDVASFMKAMPIRRGDMEYYTKQGLQVEYEHNKAIFYQFSGPLLVTYKGLNPVGQPANEATDALMAVDPTTHVDGADVTSYDLGLGYYLLDNKVACVAIFIKNYYGPEITKDDEEAGPDLAIKWNEGDHPRATDGRFGSQAGQHSGKKPASSSGGQKPDINPNEPAKPAPVDLSKLDKADGSFVEYTSNQWSQRNMTSAKLTGDETKAAYDYTRDSNVNGNLRTGKPLDEKMTRIQKGLDTAISKSTVPTGGATVYRGVRTGYMSTSDFTPGTTITDKGFASTSLKPAIAKHFAQSKDSVIMVVHLNEGDHALPIGNSRMAKFTKECEVILPRDSTYTVDRVENKFDPTTKRFHKYLHVSMGAKQ